MSDIRRLQDLDAWRAAKKLATQIYRISADGPIGHDFAYRDQVRRAAVSVMSNVAEAYGRRSPKEKARFLDFARGSGKEVESLLHLGVEIGYLDKADFEQVLSMTYDALGLVSGWARYIRRSQNN